MTESRRRAALLVTLLVRKLIGHERTVTVISNKSYYTWIYRTVLHDEASIGAVAAAHHLQMK